MHTRFTTRTSLLFSVAIIAGAAHSSPALAQEAAPSAQSGEFLGTIDIGESARAISTDTATAKTTINRKEMEERQANTVAELIDSIPGVTLVNGSTPVGSGINIRGFGANGTFGTDQKVLVMVDGATTGSEELYRIGTQLFTDPLLYKQVSVLRGTVGSFEYGSGVIGGVVRLETSDAYDLLKGKPGFTVNQSITGQANRNGFATSTTAAFMPSEQVELLANYTYRTLDDQKDGDGNRIANSHFSLPSFLVKGAVHFGADNAHTLKASYNQSSASERDAPYDSFGQANFGNVDRDTKTIAITAGYYYKPVANDAIDLSLVYTYADQKIYQQSVPFVATNALLNADHRYQTSKITLKNGSIFATGPIRHNLRAGVEYVHKKRADASAAPGGKDQRMAVFMVDEITPFSGFTLTPAVRWETSTIKAVIDNGANVSYTNEALMGGVSARYELPFGLAVFGSWARTESLPIIDDLEVTTLFRMTMPEKSETWEAGVSFDRTGLLGEGDRFAFKLNYYDTHLRDVTSYSGVSDVYLNGFEIESSYATSAGIYLDFGANIVDGERKRTSTNVNINGKRDTWTNLPANTYRLSLGKRFGRTFDIRWEAALVEDLDTDTIGTTGAVTTTTDKGYSVHTIRASFTPQDGPLNGFAVRLSAENIFDKQYTPALATRAAAGRDFKLTLSKQF